MTREEYKAAVRPFLSEKRFYHSECVAAEAEKLAKHYGADPETAWVAGILHDIMKELPNKTKPAWHTTSWEGPT